MIDKVFVRATTLSVLFISLTIFGGTQASAGDLVPLKGNFAGVGDHFFGNLTHLGKFTGVFDPVNFTAEWTAANGDTVTNQTIGFSFGEEVSPGVFVYQQSIVITGGTGRFSGASGYAEITGLFDVVHGGYCGDLVGEITKPNSQ